MKWLLLLVGILALPIANAIDSECSLVIEDNGNGLVIIQLEGEGIVEVPIQSDVKEIKVRGALYLMDNNTLELSIGSTKAAIVLYKTSLLTSKQGNEWELKFEAPNTENEKITVSMPENVIISDTEPLAMIESTDFTTLTWEGDFETISISYQFPEIEVNIENTPEDATSEPVYWPFILIPVGIIGLVLGLAFKPKRSKKQHVLKTLSKNEALVVEILMKNDGGMKRNVLEKVSKLAKSSLANTLNTLERKNIVEIDKSFTTHFVKFTRWFHEL